jgi:hypothetical protein
MTASMARLVALTTQRGDSSATAQQETGERKRDVMRRKLEVGGRLCIKGGPQQGLLT